MFDISSQFLSRKDCTQFSLVWPKGEKYCLGREAMQLEAHGHRQQDVEHKQDKEG